MLAEQTVETASRATMLGAFIEILLAAGDVASARTAADELGQIATLYGSPYLQALAARSAGAVLLAEHDARHALTMLRQSLELWGELDAPYEAAVARARI